MDGDGGLVVDEVVDYVRDGVSVNLAGVRGSGRSEVVRRAREHLHEAGCTSLLVTGVSALRERPLAALAVAGVPVPAGSGTVQISSVVQHLARREPSAPAVVVVDDADDLDAVSCGAIVAAQAQVGFTVLMVSRPGRQVGSGVRAMFAQIQPSVRVRVEPLRFEEVHALVHRLLPGTVEAQTVARIATKSGGLPGLVRALVGTGRRVGTLRQVGGAWRATDELWNPRLAQSVEPLLAGLDDADLDALTRLAVLGTVDLGRSRRLVDVTRVAALQEAGLVRVTPANGDSGQVVAVYPPLIGEYLQHEGSASARLELADALHTEGGLVSAAEDPATGDPVLLSRRVLEHWRAQARALRAEWRHDPTPATALPLVAALHAAGAPVSEVEAVVDGTTLTRAEPEEIARLLTWVTLHRAFARPDEADDERTWRSHGLLPAYQDLRSALLVHVEFLTTGTPEVPAAVGIDPWGLAALREVRAEVHVSCGRVEDALALPTAPGAFLGPVLAEQHAVTVMLATMLSGDVTAGTALALEAFDVARDALDPSGIETFGYAASLGLALAGRFDELEQLYAVLLTMTSTPWLSRQYQAGARMMAAFTATWQGRTDYADSLVAQVRADSPGPGPYPAMFVSSVDHERERALGPDEMWRVVDDRLERGYVVHALFSAAVAAEQDPDRDRIEAVVRGAADVQGPLLVALRDYLSTLRDGDPDDLTRATDALRDAGSILHATRASVAHARMLLAAGDHAAATARADRAWADAAVLGRHRAGIFRPLARDVDITEREHEVIALLASGRTVQRVAATMDLSVRTVEGHVFRSCRRLGVDSRERLIQVATTWLGIATY